MPLTLNKRDKLRQVNRFNSQNRVGSRVRFWTGARVGEGRTGEIQYPADLLNGTTPGVWITGVGFVALTHVEPEPE